MLFSQIYLRKKTKTMNENNKGVGVLYFNTRDELVRVDLRRVGYFKADRNYTDVYFLNGYHTTLPINMAALEKMLNSDQVKGCAVPFVRIGRSVIVSMLHIVHINLPKQELVLSDLSAPGVLKVGVSKEALRKLKELYRQ